MTTTDNGLNRRRRPASDTINVRRMDTGKLLALLKQKAERRGLSPVERTFVSEEIVDGMRITCGTMPSGLPFVLRKPVTP